MNTNSTQYAKVLKMARGNCYFRSLIAGLVTAVLALACAASARAADRAWTGAVSNFWGFAGNWNPTGPGPNDTAVFTDAGANHTITLLGGVTTVNALLFDSSSPYLITDGSLGLGDLTASAGLVTHDLLVDVDVAQDSTWTINSDATVVVSGQFTAPGGPSNNGVVKAGSGTLILAGNNDNVTTDLLITDGVVRLNGGGGVLEHRSSSDGRRNSVP